MTDVTGAPDTVADLDHTAELAPRTPWLLGVWLIVAGVVGEIAAFALLMEKIEALKNPGHAAGCDISIFVQCTKNLDSWQGAVLGFPNPIIGLVCWMAPILVGVAVLGGVRFPRWFWAAFNLGVLGAVVFVIWLAGQSIYVLNTLCPYCVLTWTVTYPTFFAVTFRNMAEGVFGEGVRRAGRSLLPWVLPLSIVAMLVVLGLAQLRFDFIPTLF